MEKVTVMKNFNGTLSLHSQNLDLSAKITNTRNKDGAVFSCHLRPEPPEDSEISIFDAKKYFNDANLEQKMMGNRVSPVNVSFDRVSEQCRDDLSVGAGDGDGRFSSVSSEMGRSYRTRSVRATPTASSEASWNSQAGLLTNPAGAVAVTMRDGGDQEKKRRWTARWIFGRKCPCSGEKSVQVKDNLSPEPKIANPRSRWNQSSISVPSPNSEKPKSKLENPEPKIVSIAQSRNNRFSAPSPTGYLFPIPGQSGPAKLVLPSSRVSVESLEVFQPSNQHRQFPPPNLAERDGQIFTFPASPKSRPITAADDDMASDASSDLFEIESFSAQPTANPIMGPRRDSLDEAATFNSRRLIGGGGGEALYCRRSLDEPTPSIATTECYEPSEASIDWSVTTAEGFERGSAASYTVAAAGMEELFFGGGGKRTANGLLSCRCEKAVSVGPQPQPMGKWVPPMTRQGHGGGVVVGAVGNKKPPLGCSGSARLALAFAT